MDEIFKYKTRGNALPHGKPRVFLACHPVDFAVATTQIVDDVLDIVDCAIYYIDVESSTIHNEELELAFNEMNLIIVPISSTLLSSPSDVMHVYLPYALKVHIPILPIMIEPELDREYGKVALFGNLQYLDACTKDETQIAYCDKLKKYLDSVLLSDEMAAKIRAAFDAYIFLSYRKKDRHHANELMRIIHSNPICRDIAIWYDEFLVPGEDFNESISAALAKCDLFTMLITPNVVAENNYIQQVEYPKAQSAGKDILPAVMVPTDTEALHHIFSGIPACVDARNDDMFRAKLIEMFSRYALRSNDQEPAHNFLIGLAYLEGIDVEVDRDRGVELITSAADAALPEAMSKLREMYHTGAGVEMDLREAVKWSEKMVVCLQSSLGEDHIKTLTEKSNLASGYIEIGEYQKAIAVYEQLKSHAELIIGKDDLLRFAILNNLGHLYAQFNQHDKAIEMYETAYIIAHKVYGEFSSYSLTTENNLANCYLTVGNYKKAESLMQKVSHVRGKLLGQDHPSTITSLHNQAMLYALQGNIDQAISMGEEAYEKSVKVLGEKHPDTLSSLAALAGYYSRANNQMKASSLYQQCYELRCHTLGNEHPDTVMVLYEYATHQIRNNQFAGALASLEQVCPLICNIYGTGSQHALSSLRALAYCYWSVADYQNALAINEITYNAHKTLHGELHSETISSLNNLAGCHQMLGNFDRASELFHQLVEARSEKLGPHHQCH